MCLGIHPWKRRFAPRVALFVSFVAIPLACGGVSASDPTADGGADAGSGDGASGRDSSTDGSTGADGGLDGAAGDGSTADGGYPCSAGGGPSGGVPLAYRSCSTAADCALVTMGCYCGAQPVMGVASAFESAAAKCEATRAASCALGCPIATGFASEDGKSTQVKADVKVRCIARDGGVSRCESYLP